MNNSIFGGQIMLKAAAAAVDSSGENLLLKYLLTFLITAQQTSATANQTHKLYSPLKM